MQKSITKILTRAGIIACLYIVLSLVTFGFGGGVIQLRLSEGLTLLPLFFIEAIPALFIGCILSNLITGLALLDVFLGAAVTLVASALTFFVGKLLKRNDLKVAIGGLFPILLNALILPLVWKVCYKIEYAYLIQVLFLFCSQCVSVYGVGTPIYFTVKKLQNKGVGFIL